MEQRPQVAVSPTPIKEAERLDIDGNVIDPVTKEVIKKAEEK